MAEEDNKREAEILPDYQSLVLEEPERDIELEELPAAKTLSEAEEESEHKTDLQAALKAISPRFKTKRMNDLLQPIMVSRVFPDNFVDLNFLLTMMQIEECEGDSDIDVLAIITGDQVATTIGFEGRGRVDVLEIAGVAHEEEMEKLTKELGL